MAGKSSIPIAIIRRKVREVCNMQQGYGKSEAMIAEYVPRLAGGPVSLQEVRDAMEWNHIEGYIRSEEDGESETILWYITPAGIAQQRITT